MYVNRTSIGLVDTQVLPWVARRRQGVGAVFPPWCRREQPVGFLEALLTRNDVAQMRVKGP